MKAKKNKNIFLGYFIAIIALIISGIIYREQLSYILSDPQIVKEFISSFGILGPIILILAQILQVVIFIIPGPVFTIAGGYAYGIVWGTIYSYIGTLLGSILVFYLARRFGRPFVERVVSKKDLQHFDVMYKKKGKISLFITRTMPILFPNDAISFAAGLTKITYKEYILLSAIGYVPNILILTFFGEKISSNNPWLVIILTVIGMSVLLYLFRHMIKQLVIKEIKQFEKELKIVEDKSVEITKKDLKFLEKELKLINIFKEYKLIKNFPKNFSLTKQIIANIVFFVTSLIIHPRNNTLLTKEDMVKAKKTIQKGDIVLVGSLRLLFSLMIKSPVTHTLLYIGDDKFINGTIATGVSYKTMKEAFLTYDTMIVLRLRNNVKNRKQIIEKAISWSTKNLNKPYNFNMDEKHEEFTCAELVNSAYINSGYNTEIRNFKKGNENKNILEKSLGSIKPMDFLNGNFEIAFYSKNLIIIGDKAFLVKK